MLTIASWNVNGIRAAFGHGFEEWLRAAAPDLVCLQETKIEASQLTDEISEPAGYRGIWHSGERAGYSGVATLWKEQPSWSLEGLGVPEVDAEGRVLTCELPHFFLVNTYFPNSQADRSRVEFKVEFCAYLRRFLTNLRRRGKGVVLTGDFNIAHRAIDLAQPDLDGNHSGALKEERACFDSLLEDGFVDVFRRDHPGETGHFTWWSYFAGEREANLGWRIDYFLVTEDLAPGARSWIQSDQLGSDHCPVFLELNLPKP